MNSEQLPVLSYAEDNRGLVEKFDVYLRARGRSDQTRRKYSESLNVLVDFLGAQNVLDLDRATIRRLMTHWQRKGLHPNSIRLYLSSLRAFFRFLQLSGLTKHDPTFILSQPKIPKRIPVVLTVGEVKRLIDAARDPFERAVVEVLYATGCRVSEFVNLRTEDIVWSDSDEPSSIRVQKGKGGKDRVVLIGKFAEITIREYQKWRPSHRGYLFEAPPRTGVIFKTSSKRPGKKGYWRTRLYLSRVQRELSIGSVEQFPTEAKALAELKRFLKNRPGYEPLPVRPYRPGAIRDILNRLGDRAGIDHVHPHALRRAFTTHLLAAGGDLRVVQDLLGHRLVTTTARYAALDQSDIRRAYEKAHPHAKGSDDDKDPNS